MNRNNGTGSVIRLYPAEEVGKFLLTWGLAPADVNGVAINGFFPLRCIGLLRGSKPEFKKSFFGLCSVRVSRLFVGILWFDNPKVGARLDHWVVNAYGNNYVYPLVPLARDLEEKFQVKVLVIDTGESERIERFLYY